MRKPYFCIDENKGTDQLRGNNHAADQHHCFCIIDNTIPLQFKASSHNLWMYSLVCVGPVSPGWKNPRTGFLMMWLIFI